MDTVIGTSPTYQIGIPGFRNGTDVTAKALFQRLQTQTPFAPGQLRTLQRRVREWRTEIARQLVLGAGDGAEVLAGGCNSEPGA